MADPFRLEMMNRLKRALMNIPEHGSADLLVRDQVFFGRLELGDDAPFDDPDYHALPCLVFNETTEVQFLRGGSALGAVAPFNQSSRLLENLDLGPISSKGGQTEFYLHLQGFAGNGEDDSPTEPAYRLMAATQQRLIQIRTQSLPETKTSADYVATFGIGYEPPAITDPNNPDYVEQEVDVPRGILGFDQRKGFPKDTTWPASVTGLEFGPGLIRPFSRGGEGSTDYVSFVMAVVLSLAEDFENPYEET